jgi:hypothetical protein
MNASQQDLLKFLLNRELKKIQRNISACKKLLPNPIAVKAIKRDESFESLVLSTILAIKN